MHSFLPQGVIISLVFTLRAAVSEIHPIFLQFPYLGMKIGTWKTPTGWLSNLFEPNWAFFVLFRDKGGFSKLPYLLIKIGHRKSFRNLSILLSSQGLKLTLISLYTVDGFWDAVRFSKFGPDTWFLKKKLQKLYMCLLCTGGQSLFLTLRATLPRQSNLKSK